MITPGSDEIVKLAEKYTTIPVCREIYADMITPIAHSAPASDAL